MTAESASRIADTGSRRKHGAARGCYHLRLKPICDDCREYQRNYRRERIRIEGRTPGTYRYNAIHGIGMAGEKQLDIARRHGRRARDAAGAAMEATWRN